tara:strand:- start:1143 stop:1670 length:528 start_codon:yes stop_codon:yes gene_type:complete
LASVIVGKYKGQKFFSGKNPKIRPTQGRVKKSAMQIVEPFEGKNVLDLYSGLGTLGIEALSRGAASVTFVEKYYSSIKYLKKNIYNICPNDKINLIQEDVISYLKSCSKTFDIILVDPPYDRVEVNILHSLVRSVLSKDGKYFIEMKRFEFKKTENMRIEYYGNTQVVFGWKIKI